MAKAKSSPAQKRINRALNVSVSNIAVERELVIFLQDIEDPINVGSLFRTADAMQAKLILTGRTPQPPNTEINITSRGLERKVDYEYFEEPQLALDKYKKLGFQIIALETTTDAILYTQAIYNQKVLLIAGNEKQGVYKKYLEQADLAVFSPMLGSGPSLNVNVAAAIIASFIRSA